MMTTILILITAVFAEAADFIKCTAKTESYTASISINSNSTGLFSLQKADSNEVSNCALKLNILSDKRRAIVPNVRAELEKSECELASDTKDTEILNKLILQLDLFRGEKSKTGLIQWTGKKQPDECVIEELDLDSVRHYSVRLQSGKWGRKPASLNVFKKQNIKKE